MNRIPGALRTDQQPPMAIPLGHFVLALGFLVAAVVGEAVLAVTTLPGLAGLARLHTLLVGWIAITIMGAMTQFVPVWSGVTLYSRRLARLQLWLVAAGLVGFAGLLLAGVLAWLPLAAALLLCGIWVFVYNVGRTLLRARPLDFTERHFALALACFAALAPLGFLLAVDFTRPAFDALPVGRADVVLAHATLALFGALLVTVVGALRQLATMFTQGTLDSFDHRLLGLEELLVPAGLIALAAGRGAGSVLLARIGGIALLAGLGAFTAVVARLLAGSTADRSPMSARYWVVVASLYAWIFLTVPAWWLEPVSYGTLLGHPDATEVLLFGVFGFVVVGSLYHIVPFIIWLERYSDRLGFERVPMIDDLYDDRLERADFWLTVVGVAGRSLASLFDLPAAVELGSLVVAAVGFCLFVLNMLLTIHRHGPDGLAGVVALTDGPEQGHVSDTLEDRADPDADGR
ncbi:hypothetical protein [Halopiger djelfimassiliensis]|uniref:hypothetical protein n=1 Tax=Halopiger djelfimassiliensis TaxID=1293047 RepID=UPI0006777B54|nr:hypothetical protein [Halopiger djelfimassiliensis]